MDPPSYRTVSVVRFTDLIGVFRSIPSDKSLGYFRTVRCADELIYFLGKAMARTSLRVIHGRDARATFKLNQYCRDCGIDIVLSPSIP